MKEENNMLQQVMTKPGEIIFREVPVPEVKDDQVLVKIMNIGIYRKCDKKAKTVYWEKKIKKRIKSWF